jgi:2-hydroxyglutarate dehydrogenase
MGSDEIARQIGGSDAVRIVPFRGDYYRMAPARRDLVKGLIYPVPDPRFPFLGVHFTPRMSGDVWLGPNAVLALGAEAYRRTDVHLTETLRFVRYAGFRRMALRYWRTGIAEIVRDYSRRLFLAALRQYVPELRLSDLLPGPSGIRAQAIASDGAMVDDFWYEAVPRVLVVRNAPSPAATASLVLAREIVDQAFARA